MIRMFLGLLTLLTSVTLFAHQGHDHRILGTVKMLEENRLVVETRDGSEKTVTLTSESKLTRDGEPVERNELRAGLRVSIDVDNQDRVLAIRLAAR